MTIISLPVLHTGSGYPTGWLHSDWIPDPTVVFFALLIGGAYLLYTGSLNDRRPDAVDRPTSRRQRIYFLAGCVVFLIALGQPLDDWSDNYLMSAHMLQHQILMFAVAPLWLAGTPSWLLEPLTRINLINKAGYWITRAVPAFVIANALIVLWHMPSVYDAALNTEVIHVIQHGSFLIAGLIAWWPVLGPLPAWPKLAPPLNFVYLFLIGIPGGILGAFITLGTVPFYPFYENVPRIFGISLEMDQQLAGSMMWVGSSMIYLLWATVLFFRWAAQEEDEDYPTGASSRHGTTSGVTSS